MPAYWLSYFSRMHGQWPRIGLLCIPLLLALLQALQLAPRAGLDQLEQLYGDARLRLAMPRTQAQAVAIVDIDEKSLRQLGRWPWSRLSLAQLVQNIFERQQAAVLGVDVVLAEPDDSSGLKALESLAQAELAGNRDFLAQLPALRQRLNYDAQFAQILQRYPIALGYYFTSDRQGNKSGQLPPPTLLGSELASANLQTFSWDGYGANLPLFSQAAQDAGFFNAISSNDGLIRRMPLLAQYQGNYYQSLPLAMLRLAWGQAPLGVVYPKNTGANSSTPPIALSLKTPQGKQARLPIDAQLAAEIPFRGPGGPSAGSFAYFSASDILQGKTPAGSLKNKLVLLGTSAPGLLDLRTTPVGDAYPGVEVHANMLMGLLEGRLSVRPDYALAYEVLSLLLLGLFLILTLPLLSAPRSIALGLTLCVVLIGLNTGLYLGAQLLLPLVSALLLVGSMLALNLAYGYFVANRSKRDLAQLFGSYVPSELVDEMLKDPKNYNMRARNKELSVMFCDLRGFTKMAEGTDPLQVQALLNRVFGHFTEIIRKHGGTIDKYMGDCVMAFWGAPLEMTQHAQVALRCAAEIAASIPAINADLHAAGLMNKNQAPLGVSIALNTGIMCVGNMGTELRQAYTVIGDEVNLASRIEPLSRLYGVDIITTEAVREHNPDWIWQELDIVQVKGRQAPERIFSPIAKRETLDAQKREELKAWLQFLQAYRHADVHTCEVLLLALQRMQPKFTLYQLYAERLELLRESSPSQWQTVAIMGPSKYSPLI